MNLTVFSSFLLRPLGKLQSCFPCRNLSFLVSGLLRSIILFLFLCVVSVGEPINFEAWEWLHKVVGDSRCTLVDTWWQTGESPQGEGAQACLRNLVPGSLAVYDST